VARASLALRSFPLTRCGDPFLPVLFGARRTGILAGNFLPGALADTQEDSPMYDSFASQLAGLDLSGFTIAPAPFNATDFPCEDAIDQTLAAVWSDLYAMFSDTALEADAEDIAWGLVNLFHRAASRKSAQLDRASDRSRRSQSTANMPAAPGTSHIASM